MSQYSEYDIYDTRFRLLSVLKDRVILALEGITYLDEEQYTSVTSPVEMTICQDYHTIRFKAMIDDEEQEVEFSWGAKAPTNSHNLPMARKYSGIRTEVIRELVNNGFFPEAPELKTPVKVRIKKIDIDAYEIHPVFIGNEKVLRPYTINGDQGKTLSGKMASEEYKERLLDGSKWLALVDKSIEDEIQLSESVNNEDKKDVEPDVDPEVQAYRDFLASL